MGCLDPKSASKMDGTGGNRMSMSRELPCNRRVGTYQNKCGVERNTVDIFCRRVFLETPNTGDLARAQLFLLGEGAAVLAPLVWVECAYLERKLRTQENGVVSICLHRKGMES